jgi:hypothetical protein
MKKTGMLLSALLVVAAVAQAADIKFDGQVRYRMENSNDVFDADVDSYNFALLRTRINMTATPQDGLKVFVQAQDSRTLGAEGAGISAGLADDNGLGVHQAYFAWDCKLVGGMTLLAGRFEYAKADHRFFGNVGWANTGRAMEGWALLFRGFSFAEIDVFGVKATEAGAANMDVTDFGLYFGNVAGMGIDVFYNMLDLPENAAGDANGINTLGIHYGKTYNDAIGVNFNFATQMGTNEQGVEDSDYSGMMYDLDLSYKLDMGFLNKIGFGYESMSGQDDSGDVTAWQDLFPTAHKFHGYQDIVGPVFSGGHAGLNDIEFNFWGALPIGGLSYKLDFHMLSYVEDTGLEGNTDLGSEFDLTLKKKMGKFGVNLGYSMFMPADNYDAIGDAQSWMYLQWVANF